MEMHRTFLTALIPALALAACAGPESRIESALTGAGLSPRVSKCMAGRMVDRLSVGQLLKLRSLGGLAERPMGELSTREFLRRVRALEDPEILAVTSSALARCTLGV
jgi:hypothetical protein